MRVVVANVYPDHNRGSAALTLASIELVRRAFPGADISLVSIPPLHANWNVLYRHTLRYAPDIEILQPPGWTDALASGVKTSFLSAAVPDLSRERHLALHRLREASLVVSRGGVIFRARGSVATARSLLRRTLPLRIAIRWGVPVALVGSHIDSFTHPLERRVASGVISGASLVLPRDEFSAANARALGASESRLRTIPDSALFIDPAPRDAALELAERYGLEPGRFLVATVSDRPRDAVLREQTSDALATACGRLLEAGFVEKIALSIQVSGSGPMDEPHVRLLGGRLPAGKTVLLEEDLGPRELAGIYGLSAGVVGTRLHATVLGLAGGVPGIPLAVTDSHRMPGVYRRLGLEELVVRSEATSADRLASRLTSMLADPDLRDRVSRAVTMARTELDAVPSLLASLVQGSPTHSERPDQDSNAPDNGDPGRA